MHSKVWPGNVPILNATPHPAALHSAKNVWQNIPVYQTNTNNVFKVHVLFIAFGEPVCTSTLETLWSVKKKKTVNIYS